MKRLIKKVFIRGEIELYTGLHIGGSSSAIEIGGVDKDVVKTGNGVPYIPGSSLKGKMRTLLGRVRGYESVEKDGDELKDLFGNSGGKDNRFLTRLIVRDAPLNVGAFEALFGKKEERNLDFEYSEVKAENTIARSTSKANPRQMERVPAGAIFDFELALDVYEGDDHMQNLRLLKEGMELLDMDYLGGMGSRGSGRIKFSVKEIGGKEIGPGGTSDLEDREEIEEIFANI